MERIIRLAFVMCVVFLISSLATAQPQVVAGRAIDAQGGAIANADVTLLVAGKPVRSARTAQDGSFHVESVESGEYTVLIEAVGFSPSSETVAGTAPRSLVITLQVAGISEDITVQALAGTVATGRTTLPLRELPLTVNTVSSQLIEEQAANDLPTAIRNVSGVNAFTAYGVYEYYNFRGFFDSVQLLDGVRNEGNRVNTQLINIERIEVLKGPSSALYGASALGATVNLIRKKPTTVPTQEFSASAGSWKTGRFAFGSGGRLGSDAALYRFDVGAETKEGYRKNDSTRLTINPSLLWRAGGNNQINMFYTFNRDRFGGDAGLPLTDSDFGVPVDDNVLNVPRDRNYRTPYDEAVSYDNNLQVGYARQLSNSLGFRNTTSYRHFDDKYFLSEEIYFVPPETIDRYYLYFNHHRRPLQNVAELTGYFTKGIEQNLVVGYEALYYRSNTPLPDNDYFQAESINAFNPVETQGPSVLEPETHVNHFTALTNALYVQDHLTLGPKVKALLGGRIDIYRRESSVDPIVSGEQQSGSATERDAEAFTGRVGLVYQPSRVVDLYGSFANAFKPLTLAQPDGTTLDPETGSQWEVGQRFHLKEDRVQLNTAVYRILRQNVAFRRPAGFYAQAGEVRSRGFEADLQTTLRTNSRIGAAYGFTDAEFLDYEETVGTNLRGNTPVFAPRHTFNVWTAYDWSNGFGVNVGVRYMSEVFADNTNQFEVDGYGVLNLAARYRRGPFEFALNINNVTDTQYFTPHLDWAQVYPGDPINVLGTVRVRLR